MNTENMETLITSETILQQTVCWEIERPNKDQKFLEVAKKVPHTCHTDTEQFNGGITESEQTQSNLNTPREVYFYLIKPQRMACTKHSPKKGMVREGRKRAMGGHQV